MRLLFGNLVGRTSIDHDLWFRYASDYGRYMLFVAGIPSTNVTLDWDKVNLTDVGYALMTTFGWTAENLVEMFVENLCVTVTITMWIATNLFVRCLNKNCHEQWTMIYVRYKLLRKLSQMINNGFAMWMGLYLVQSTCYLMAGIDNLVHLRVTGSYVTSILSQTVILITLLLAAKTSGQMNEMKVWIINNHELIPERDSNVLINELQWNMIGIRAGRNMGVITYSILWNVSENDWHY